MSTQTNSVSPQAVAHHEAGHAVAGVALGVEFKEVRIAPGKDGKIGVPLKTNPWLGPRPSSNPGELTDEEWAALSQSEREWEQWKKRDHEKYAIFCFAGKAAQLEYSGESPTKTPRQITLLWNTGFPIINSPKQHRNRRQENWSGITGSPFRLWRRNSSNVLF